MREVSALLKSEQWCVHQAVLAPAVAVGCYLGSTREPGCVPLLYSWYRVAVLRTVLLSNHRCVCTVLLPVL